LISRAVSLEATPRRGSVFLFFTLIASRLPQFWDSLYARRRLPEASATGPQATARKVL
jgi:hypothetical protein